MYSVGLAQMEARVTGRRTSMFDADMSANAPALMDRARGSRIAVIGAAGSIGASVVKELLRYEPRALVLFDLNENGLVELIRDVRSSADLRLPPEFAELPIGFGSVEFQRYFSEAEPFDYILNLSAIKHVRSEKNIYCLMRMVDTNILFLGDFIAKLSRPCRKVFSVSSDKAVNPANLMGATKMAMEKVLLLRSDTQPFSTARFANVAFSAGSLPYGFLMRIQKRQPIAAPRDVKRYFISHEEAGHLCVLSCLLGDNGDVFYPKLDNLPETTFADVAVNTLHAHGYEAYECSSEEEARNRMPELTRQRRWPCFFANSDTTGEKAYEEFLGDSEDVDLERYSAIGVIHQSFSESERARVERFLAFASAAKTADVTKQDYITALKSIVPSLCHLDRGRSLDDKM